MNPQGTNSGDPQTPSPFRAPSYPTTPYYTPPPPNPYEEDIQRGLALDFYRIKDPVLCASWASFFRDQYMMLRNSYAAYPYYRPYSQVPPSPSVPYAAPPPSAYAGGTPTTPHRDPLITGVVQMDAAESLDPEKFLQVFKDSILPSPEMQQLLKRTPFTSVDDLNQGGHKLDSTSSFANAVFDVIFRLSPQRKAKFDTPEWREQLWNKHGLSVCVCKAQADCRQAYYVEILNAVDSILKEAPNEGHDVFLSKLKQMFKETDGTGRPMTKATVQVFSQLATRRYGVDAKQAWELQNSQIELYFAPLERAFVLTAIRKHLLGTPVYGEHLHYEEKFDVKANASFAPQDLNFLFGLCQQFERPAETTKTDGDGSGAEGMNINAKQGGMPSPEEKTAAV